MLICSQMRFSSSQLSSRLFWAKMWWTRLEPPAASLVLVISTQLLELDWAVVSGSREGWTDLILVRDYCHLPEDDSQRRALWGSERGSCQLWLRFWVICYCLVVLEVGISHLLQEYWCHSMLHLQLWCLGAGSGLLNSDFKEMSDGEGERNETSWFDKMLNHINFS